MARPRDPAIKARNEEIYARFMQGETVADLAVRYDRKPVVIGRIIKKQIPEQADDTNRALMRGRLEWLLSEMRDVINNPGVKLGPNGRPAEDFDGEPMADLTTKIEASKVFLAVLDRAAKNEGSDKQQERKIQVEHSIAHQQMLEDIEQRRRALGGGRGVIQGQIEPPGKDAA